MGAYSTHDWIYYCEKRKKVSFIWTIVFRCEVTHEMHFFVLYLTTLSVAQNV
jgi:hypothetical protein